MTKNIIFDFGDVFINLDKQIVFKEIERFEGNSATVPIELQEINNAYEIGKISSEEFIKKLQKIYPGASFEEIVTIWNGMILDFPEYRLKFIEALAKENKYKLFLLSNTNELHIAKVKRSMGIKRYERFKGCFEGFYLSQEIHLRKPNAEIFEFVLRENGLKPEETFFIDDTKEHTDTAEKSGIRSWNIQVGKEDIINLKTRL